jgi:acetoacetyl-CoA synthetase
MEVPVRRILMGTPLEQAANCNTMANPDSLNFFVNYAKTQKDYSLGAKPGFTGGEGELYSLEESDGR